MHVAESSPKLTFRLARLDDAAAICEVHKSHVFNWYRIVDSEQFDVEYDHLSVEDRWGFGGPWMSPETCAIHLNNLLLMRHLPYVAELGGRIVAEMELFIGREGEPYGRNCHIGLLYVHKDFTGKGTGISLIRHAREVARERGCESLTVSAMPHNEAFYLKCGFSYGHRLVQLNAPVRRYMVETSALQPPLSKQSFTWGMDLTIGRLQSSAYHLFELSDSYALPAFASVDKRTSFLSVSGHPSMITWTSGSIEEATVYAWSSGASARDLAAAAMKLLEPAGIRNANLLLTRDDYESLSGEIDAALVGTRATLIYPL
ncbi:GNAT family N-acetyltransferase [Methanocella arvoryzae]|uniref:Acetyltransferase (GNAT family) n=1 Tax=Methanocella arvoryzae (strain DSM 22066 / NBRC 105507 / MRE50) TaxID=351160 RepID=Q0W121_METAR|nr:GNAT family N-acetyltransferase [Methanocella arvoryzae]CAJ37922.1 putative acetyltransferase (GNAT family) [Methanocella arvoryzae MRE50]